MAESIDRVRGAGQEKLSALANFQLGQKGDLGSQDLLIGLSSVIDKHLWMLRAHSQTAGE